MVFGRRKPTSSSGDAAQSSSSDALQVEDEDPNDDGDKNSVEQAPPKSSIRVPSFQQPVAASSSTQLPVENYRFGIMERLNDAVEMKTNSSASYRSPDLIPLMKSFDSMRKKLRQMIGVAKKYHQSMITIDYDRIQMAKEIASFTAGSPLEGKVGSIDDTLSYISVFHNASKVSAKHNLKYKNDIIDYCVEWEAVISKRVDNDVHATKKLREMFNHYQDKVDTLRKKVNLQETKGKNINITMTEKLQRNEEKLDEASELYESSALPLCILIEEVVQYGYKDLFPLVVATMKFEMERSHNESRAFHLFQKDVLENEFGEHVKVTTAAGRPSSSFNGKSKDQHAVVNPKKVNSKKSNGSKSSSAGNAMKHGKNVAPTSMHSSATGNKLREETAAGAINNRNDSEGSSESTWEEQASKVDAV